MKYHFLNLRRSVRKVVKRNGFVDVVNYIINNSELVDIIMNKHILPIKEITDNIKLNRKAIERHRKYIITAVIAITQDYPAIAEYFNMREV